MEISALIHLGTKHMLTQHKSLRLWMAGLVCLLATSASAQERTADLGSRDQSKAGQVRPVSWNQGYYTPVNYNDPWANYGPNGNVYPNYTPPNRGYVSYSHSGGTCCPWFHRWNCGRCNGAACRDNFGHRFRCSMAWLKPITYWDAGIQTDIIAVNPGYAHPSDLNQGYAAQGYGGPVSVPQAPNVRSNFNYGWGLPSSRLTPTSFPYGY
jgi:hypothetical protein